MHRTKLLLRILSWSMFAGLALHLASLNGSVCAQDVIPKEGDGPKVMGAVVNITKSVGMTRAAGAAEDPIIEKVTNENPKVVRIQSIFNDPRHVLITGLSPGVSRVTFTGYTDPNQKDRHDEVFEVRVVSDDSLLREQLRKDFLTLVKKVAPTANIDVTVVFSTTTGPVMVSTTTGSNAPDAINRTGVTDSRMVAFITGNVMSADVVNVILESARAMFGNTVQIVNQMTVGGVQQVEVDCVICSVNRSKTRSMSFNWSVTRRDWFLSSILGPANLTQGVTSILAPTTAQQTTSGGNLVFGSVTQDGSFLAFLSALRTDGLAKIQAEPKVVTLSGRPAQFVSGGETPILTTSGQGAPNVTYKTFGTTITVLPIVLGNGKIHLEIAPLISTLNQAAGISITGGNTNTQVPGFATQGAQVAVQVEDGQTIAIGGLIQHTVNATNAKVPVLGDVPFLGAAFRTVNYAEKEEELIILVTPRLIDPMGCDQLPGRLPTRLTRSPDDFELYLEGMLELPRGARQTCGPNGVYQAGYLNGPTAGMFPCGDQGRCGSVFGQYGSCTTGNCGTGACRPGNSPCAPSVSNAGSSSTNSSSVNASGGSALSSPNGATINVPHAVDQVNRTPAEQSPMTTPTPTELPPPSNVSPAGFRPMPTNNAPVIRVPAASPGMPE